MISQFHVRRLGGLLLLAALALGHTARAETVTVWNPGFEQPVLGKGSFSSDVPGWGSNTPLGVAHPGNSMPAAPQGNQYLWGGASGNFTVTQLTGALQANNRYDFSIKVYPVTNPEEARFTVQLIEQGSSVIMADKLYRPFWITPPPPGIFGQPHPKAYPDLRQFEMPAGQWTTVNLSFSTADLPASAGSNLLIQITGAYVAIDDIQFTRQPMIQAATGQYFVSSSEGDDANTGLTPETPWKTFAPVNQRIFAPGSAIFLKRGDVWNEELNLRGNGADALFNYLSAYGEANAPLPHIRRGDRDYDKGIILHNGSYWVIEQVSVRNAALGLFLRYFKHTGAEAIFVRDCRFEDIDSWLVDAATRGYEWAIPSAVWIGGSLPGGDGQNATVVNNVNIQNCAAENVTCGYGGNFYFPPMFRSRINNLTIEDSYATRVSIGGLSLNTVSNSTIRRFRTFGKCGNPGNFVWGSTGGIISKSQNVLFEDCEFSETDRMWSDKTMGDGCGFDIDGQNDSITMRHCLFHNNEGAGLLFLSTGGINTNIVIEDCTFWNNATDASDGTYTSDRLGNSFEIKVSDGTAQNVTIRRCGLYRGPNTLNHYYSGTFNSNVVFQNLRLSTWGAVSGRLTQPAWDWAGNDVQGWNNWSQWTPVVGNGHLSGNSAGNDPFGYSPPLWANSLRATPKLKVRLRATAGDMAVLFFTTEHDSAWNIDKAIAIQPLITDGQWHDYTVDLRNSPNYKGVVTQIRLDPTDVAGAQFGVDHVRLLPDVEEIAPSLSWLPGTGSNLRFNSDPGTRFRLYQSSDLIEWTPQRVFTTDANGRAEHIDESAHGAPRRFYKLGLEP